MTDGWTGRILDAPRVAPNEASLKPALDALGGEVVKLRARDGLRLGGRWLPAEAAPAPGATDGGSDTGGKAPLDPWRPDPYEAILLLHGWTGSIVPDLVELGPTLRRTAGVLGLDFRGHGTSDEAPSTFGLHEIEDVAGALDWLGERGIRRVVLVGSSMGGTVAIAAIVVLGDGTLRQADLDPAAPAASVEAPRPRIVGAVAESVPTDLRIPIANRIRLPLGGPIRRAVAGRLFSMASRRLGGDIRATEAGRIVRLVDPVPLLLIHGGADRTVPPKDGRRLAALAGPATEHWEVPGADHRGSRPADPAQWDLRVSRFVRQAFLGAREVVPIIHTSGEPTPEFVHAGPEGD
ncbi:MAG TPA: alpha/beta fold hydrolase [Candidatus Limnocylindrales bacterium]|nr:alpha/beta fold hydrolase [Candidatus Limnocylindrales bacterium]